MPQATSGSAPVDPIPTRFRAWQLQDPATQDPASQAPASQAPASQDPAADRAQSASIAPLLGRFVDLGLEDLSPGNVVIRVDFTSINYKDALAAAGRNRIVRDYPRVGGIDLVGRVAQSAHPGFKVGDAVIAHGFGIGVDHDGGHAEYARIDGDWLVALPDGLSAWEAAAIGVAGYTAALSVHWMEHNGLVAGGAQAPGRDRLPIAVTGATGGAASFAIDLLAGQGHEVVAVSGKADAHDYLRALGASAVIDGSDLITSGRPLESVRFGGGVDSVGGAMLAGLLRTAASDAPIASFGNAAGLELNTTVLPFILRGVRLIGINANSPMPLRRQIWQRLASDLKPRHFERIVETHPFDDLPQALQQMLARRTRGRLVFRHDGAPR